MTSSSQGIERARRFTRFYTRETELLNEGLLQSRFTLTEVRVLYELAHRTGANAAELGRDLGLDRGYLSRIVARFEQEGLVARERSGDDRRRSALSLTEAGREAFGPLDSRSEAEWRSRLDRLGPADRSEVAAAMSVIEGRLGPPGGEPIRLRRHAVGDLGWIARRQGLLYAAEYGFDVTFEALVAEILAAFMRDHDPARERAWIAERGEEVVGSVFLVAASDEVAKLRLLYVEPSARGHGLGARLVAECVGFARQSGYAKLVLWTNDCLTAARAIYVKAGFALVEEEHHRSFGLDLVGQNWSLDL